MNDGSRRRLDGAPRSQEAFSARPLVGREIPVEVSDEELARMRARTAARYGIVIPDDAPVFRQTGRLSASMPGIYVALQRASEHFNYKVPDADEPRT